MSHQMTDANRKEVTEVKKFNGSKDATDDEEKLLVEEKPRRESVTDDC